MTADPISRFLDPEDFRLNPTHFQHFLAHLQATNTPLPTIDAMASSLNAQLPLFCARFHNRANTHTDFFSVDWSAYQAIYLNPPFSVIPRVLAHLRQFTPQHTYILTPHPHIHPHPVWWTWLHSRARRLLALPLHRHLFTTLRNRHCAGHLAPRNHHCITYLTAADFNHPSADPVTPVPADEWTFPVPPPPAAPSPPLPQLRWPLSH